MGTFGSLNIMTAETGAKWVLRFITLTTLPAFVAAAMPQRWLVLGLNWIEPGFSPGLFGSYLIRCLMGVYAFLGIQTAIWSTDVRRYRPLILNLCLCVLLVVPLALLALMIAVPPAAYTRAFWIIFLDLTEGLAHTGLLAVLVRRIPDKPSV
jgi:general stress protein CsbA